MVSIKLITLKYATRMFNPFYNTGSQNRDLCTERCSCSRTEIGISVLLSQKPTLRTMSDMAITPSEIQERVINTKKSVRPIPYLMTWKEKKQLGFYFFREE